MRENEKVRKIQDMKSVSLFDKWIFHSFWDYRFYRIMGVSTAAGAEVKAEALGSVIINESFMKREEMCSVEMLNCRLNAQGGFTTAAVALPMR